MSKPNSLIEELKKNKCQSVSWTDVIVIILSHNCFVLVPDSGDLLDKQTDFAAIFNYNCIYVRATTGPNIRIRIEKHSRVK